MGKSWRAKILGVEGPGPNKEFEKAMREVGEAFAKGQIDPTKALGSIASIDEAWQMAPVATGKRVAGASGQQTDDPCASCGTPRSRHHPSTVACPRYVQPRPAAPAPNLNPIPASQAAQSRKGFFPVTKSGMEEYYLNLFGPNGERVQGGISEIERRVAELRNHVEAQASLIGQMRDEIHKLKKWQECHNFDPLRRYGEKEKPDYTQWRDDEDNLTDTNRGVPEVKPKVIF